MICDKKISYLFLRTRYINFYLFHAVIVIMIAVGPTTATTSRLIDFIQSFQEQVKSL